MAEYQAPAKHSHRWMVENRIRKANKVLNVLKDYRDISDCVLLDIGTGSGHIPHEFSKHVKKVFSTNINDERIVKDGYEFVLVQDEHLPFPDEQFDLIVINHVIEHVPDQALFMREIKRVVKKNGLVYVGTPNKWRIIEPHTRLPFCSWLPASLSQLYVKTVKKRDWDVFPLSYRKLAKLCASFEVDNITLRLFKDPKQYHVDVYKGLHSITSRLPIFALKFLVYFSPSFVIVLKKRS